MPTDPGSTFRKGVWVSTYNEYKYDLVPLYLYEGDFLFAHGTEWGVHLLGPQKTFNIDLIARYLERLLGKDEDGMSVDFLKEHGYA